MGKLTLVHDMISSAEDAQVARLDKVDAPASDTLQKLARETVSSALVDHSTDFRKILQQRRDSDH